jgi:selenocysteine lyase/cysteine desulfurase
MMVIANKKLDDMRPKIVYKEDYPMNLEEVRRVEFPETERITFLDAACVSFAPQRAVKALTDFVNYCSRNDEESSSAHHIAMDEKRQKAYIEAAKLLNADIDEIALVESTTHGLNIAATSIPLNRGDKILTTSLEFLQVAMPWCMMRKKQGIRVEVIQGQDGRFEKEDFENAIDENTKIIVISSVEWCNGWKMDLKELGQLCKEKGVYLVVDAIHHLGVNRIDVKEVHIDILMSGGHKWLNSPFGTGVLYVNKELIPRIDPVFWGYLNLEEPEGGWPAYFENPKITPVNDWKFRQTANKFEIGGTSNYPGAIALGESLELINEIGIENIEKHVFELTEYAMGRLKEIGATLITHPDKKHRSGIVIFRFYNSIKEEEKLLEELHENGVYVAMRFTSNIGGIRVSCHYFNTKGDIDKLIEALKKVAEVKKPDY